MGFLQGIEDTYFGSNDKFCCLTAFYKIEDALGAADIIGQGTDRRWTFRMDQKQGLGVFLFPF